MSIFKNTFDSAIDCYAHFSLYGTFVPDCDCAILKQILPPDFLNSEFSEDTVIYTVLTFESNFIIFFPVVGI